MLVELELPRLLAPDLPSTRSSLKDLKCTHSNYRTWSPALLFFVTTSPCREWVSCAPAAFLGCGSRFSCSLSGIEPWFPVTRYKHGRHVTYHRHLIGQTFERCVAGTEAMRSAQSYPESPIGRRPRTTDDWFWTNKSALSRGSELAMHVLALELPQLSK